MRHECIEIDELAQPVRHLFGSPGDDDAAGSVRDQDDIMEVFVPEDVHDIEDMGRQINVPAGEMESAPPSR